MVNFIKMTEKVHFSLLCFPIHCWGVFVSVMTDSVIEQPAANLQAIKRHQRILILIVGNQSQDMICVHLKNMFVHDEGRSHLFPFPTSFIPAISNHLVLYPAVHWVQNVQMVSNCSRNNENQIQWTVAILLTPLVT